MLQMDLEEIEDGCVVISHIAYMLGDVYGL